MNQDKKIKRKLIEMAEELGIDFKNSEEFISLIRVMLKYAVFDFEASERERKALQIERKVLREIIRKLKEVIAKLEEENDLLNEENEEIISENEYLNDILKGKG